MEETSIRYPIGVQSFEELRGNGYVYIDKTRYISELTRRKFYFLSRPRRFGKSLLLSTLEAYFRGRKELFEGLHIYSIEKEWRVYPVVHIDFNSMRANRIEDVPMELRKTLFDIACSYDVEIGADGFWEKREYPVGRLFEDLIKALHDKYGSNVVVLIDEYDKAIIEVLHDEEMRLQASDEMRPFFSVLKSADKYIKFAFITGVSRFRNTTIFSGANNLQDISLDRRYASMLGITHEEVTHYFRPALENFARNFGWSYEETLKILHDRYDGYRFTSAEEYVYNPFSLLNALDFQDLQDFWVRSGTSKILATFLRNSGYNLQSLTDRWVSASELGATYSTDDPISLFFQTGYLTINEYKNEEFRLGIPNQEVQRTMVNLLIPEFVINSSDNEMKSMQRNLRYAIESGDIDTMMKNLKALMASVPYHHIVDSKTLEKHMHLVFYVVFLMLGIDTKCEIAESAGRVDMVAQTPWRVYVFEFKVDKSPQEALRQIDEKGYAIPWEADGRTVIKIGVNFSSATRTLDSWVAQEDK